MEKEPKKKKPIKYRSPESRARQLAGLSGVKIEDHVPGVQMEKLNGKGVFAGVSEEQRKQILEMFCNGMSCRAIGERMGLGRQTVDDIKNYYLDNDSQFRTTFFQTSVRNKLQTVIDGAADRLIELKDEMSAKDAAITLGIAIDKYTSLQKNKGPEQLHQHVHIHGVSEIGDAIKMALNKPTDGTTQG